MSKSRGGERRLAATLAAVTAIAAGAVVAAPGRIAALLEASARALRSGRAKRKPVRVRRPAAPRPFRPKCVKRACKSSVKNSVKKGKK